MSDDSPELSQFLEIMQTEIKKGMTSDFYLKGDIDIELAVVKTKNVGGKFKILVAEAGGKYEKETMSKIKFKIAQRGDYSSRIVKTKGWT